MTKKKSLSKKPPAMKVGNISEISGNVSIAGRDIITHHTATGLSAADLAKLFGQLYAAIESHAKTSPAEKEDLKAEIKDIQSTITEAAQKSDLVDEGFVSRRFRNIARMAPDILEMVVATLGGPLAGLGVMARKIAEKAKEETKTN